MSDDRVCPICHQMSYRCHCHEARLADTSSLLRFVIDESVALAIEAHEQDSHEELCTSSRALRRIQIEAFLRELDRRLPRP
jgi:hypothetical protein